MAGTVRRSNGRLTATSSPTSTATSAPSTAWVTPARSGARRRTVRPATTAQPAAVHAHINSDPAIPAHRPDSR